MITVNLPLALVTIILRRFIDKLRTTQGPVILKSTPLLMDTSVFKSCMYAYMFCAGLYYTIKHMRRGTIVTLARRCSESALTISDRYVRRGNYLNRNRSTLVRSIVSGREGQQKALRYLAESITPRETVLQPSSNIISSLNSETVNSPSQNVQLDRSYISNPYFEPSGIGRNQNRCGASHRRRHNLTVPNIDTILEPQSAGSSANYDLAKVIRASSQELSPIDIETISISDHDEFSPPPPKTKQKRKQRNCLTLRGRKVVKNDLSFSGEKIVRKTRSGKVYGYQTGLPKFYKRRKT